MKDGTVVFQDELPDEAPSDARLLRWYKLFLQLQKRPGVEALIWEWTAKGGVKMNNATWQRKVIRDRPADYMPPGRWRLRAVCQVNKSQLFATYVGESDAGIAEIMAGSRGPSRIVPGSGSTELNHDTREVLERGTESR